MRGSIGVSVLPRSLLTHRVLRSHEGVTCCGSRPTAKCRMIVALCWSMTSTVPDWEFGTYTRAGTPRAAAARRPGASAA